MDERLRWIRKIYTLSDDDLDLIDTATFKSLRKQLHPYLKSCKKWLSLWQDGASPDYTILKANDFSISLEEFSGLAYLLEALGLPSKKAYTTAISYLIVRNVLYQNALAYGIQLSDQQMQATRSLVRKATLDSPILDIIDRCLGQSQPTLDQFWDTQCKNQLIFQITDKFYHALLYDFWAQRSRALPFPSVETSWVHYFKKYLNKAILQQNIRFLPFLG